MPVRYIDPERCIGCATCIEACPMDVFRLDPAPESRVEESPCSAACPLELNQGEYHNLINLRMVDEAAELIQKRHPMPAITGRVCPHPCETPCTRGLVDEAININGLEQYLGDYLFTMGLPKLEQSNGRKVAIIGSGPAGVSAAYNLAIAGYAVTVFEKDAKPGGLLRYSVPSFRLHEEVLDKQFDVYRRMGIEIKCNVQIGKDVTKRDLVKQGYEAFVAATGSSRPFKLTVPGAEAGGIISAIDFLRDVKTGTFKRRVSKVAVIGGGSVALDSARSAARLGAEVHLVCLEKVKQGTKDSMLALESEIHEAIEEGVVFHESSGVEAFETAGGNVAGVRCVGCSSVRDEDGRFNPKYTGVVDGTIQVDTVIVAIGQTADKEMVPVEFMTNERGFIVADKRTLHVSAEMFAAGDATTGPTTVVEALGQGKRVALVVDRFFKGVSLAAGLDDPIRIAKGVPRKNVYRAPRIQRATLPVAVRVVSFEETQVGLSDKQAKSESNRCFTCGAKAKIAYMDDCQVCRLCAHFCPTDAIEITDGQWLGSLHQFNVVKLGTEYYKKG